MLTYEYGHVKKLAKALEDAGIEPVVSEEILAGGELIGKGDKSEKKAEWVCGAMDRMDALLDESTRHAVREACACCLGGKRGEISRKIGRSSETLEDAVKAANEARFVFGHSVSLEDDGSITVRFEEEGKESYRCVCLPKASKEPVSITYCYCCGGHVKHHLQNALRQKLACTVLSTALSSGGKTACSFSFTTQD